MIHSINFYPALKPVLNGHHELLKGLTFDEIAQAAKLQHTKGNEAARNYLQAFQTKAKAS